MALLLFVLAFALTPTFAVTLARGGQDRLAFAVLGVLVVVFAYAVIARPTGGVFAVIDGIVLGIVAGTAAIFVIRKRAARAAKRDSDEE